MAEPLHLLVVEGERGEPGRSLHLFSGERHLAYLLKMLRMLRTTLSGWFSSTPIFSSSPSSKTVTPQLKQRSISMPRKRTVCSSIPHLGQRIQCSRLSSALRSSSSSRALSCASFRSFSAFSLAKNSSSARDGLGVSVICRSSEGGT